MEDHLNPFVMQIKASRKERHGTVDLYLPEADEPRPAIVFVHGGPLPAAVTPRPHEWPVFAGYGAMAAAAGVLGAVVAHRLHTPADYPLVAAQVQQAIDTVRADPRADADRVALWFFSGGALLMADWVNRPPDWLRCVAATYPVLAPLPGWPVEPRFHPTTTVGDCGKMPIVLTRAGREHELIAAGVQAFVDAADAANCRLEIIDVPNGRHGFDYLDPGEESRDAVETALGTVLSSLA
ncbi:dienelactone hydrolase family protein [Rhizocola hellebori]|nr:dienelactone hydrolase family protein [Rhizocola hellebori]